jgi:hypothetical protein
MKNTFLSIVLLIVSLSTYAQNRIVLLEQFSNAGCPPCAMYTPGILSYVDVNPSKITAISYHTAYPYLDSMYYENPVESDARVDFYGSFGVPYSILDGNYYRNNSASLSTSIGQTVNSRVLVESKFNIQKINSQIQNRMLSGGILFKSLSDENSDENLRAFIVVVEKRVEKSDYKASPGKNSELYYSYVMRKFMTNVNGLSIINKNINDTTQVWFNWDIKNFKDIAELRIIAFVQNIDTKEIYQSILINPFESSTGLEQEKQSELFSAYPNPSKSELFIETENEEAFEFYLYDNMGKLVKQEKVRTSRYQLNNLANGIYLLRVTQGNLIQSKKIIVQN